MNEKGLKMVGRGIDGTAKPLAVDNDGILINKEGTENILVTITNTILPDTSETVFSTTRPCVIDFIDWVPRDENHARIIIENNGGAALISTLGTDTVNSVTPKMVLDGVSLYWNVVIYDTSISPAPIIRFHLKRPLYCVKGVRIIRTNSSSDNQFRNSVQIRGRYLT